MTTCQLQPLAPTATHLSVHLLVSYPHPLLKRVPDHMLPGREATTNDIEQMVLMGAIVALKNFYGSSSVELLPPPSTHPTL